MTMDVVIVILIIFFFSMGIVQMITGKVLGIREDEYTPESVKKYSKVTGALSILMGLLIGAIKACQMIPGMPTIIKWACLILFVLTVFGQNYFMRRILVRR